MDYNNNMPGYNNNQYGPMMPAMPNNMQQPMQMQMPQMVCIPVYWCSVMPQGGMQPPMPYMGAGAGYCPDMYEGMNQMPYNPTYDYTMPEME